MRYQPLFDLAVHHGAYPGGYCRELRVEPRAGHPIGERALARYRMAARQRPGGLQIAVRIEDREGAVRPMVPFASDLVLGFDLCASGSELATVTDLSAWAGVATPTYRGEGPAGGPLQLVADAPAAVLPPGVVALIEIAGITPQWLDHRPSFTLDLAARQSLWVYYLLTQRPQSEVPRIQDAAAEHPLDFICERLTPGDIPASADPIGSRLLARYPEHRCFRLASRQPIAVHRAARRQLSLYLGQDLLMRSLPSPSIPSLTMLALDSSEPRMSLYHVIEC